MMTPKLVSRAVAAALCLCATSSALAEQVYYVPHAVNKTAITELPEPPLSNYPDGTPYTFEIDSITDLTEDGRMVGTTTAVKSPLHTTFAAKAVYWPSPDGQPEILQFTYDHIENYFYTISTYARSISENGVIVGGGYDQHQHGNEHSHDFYTWSSNTAQPSLERYWNRILTANNQGQAITTGANTDIAVMDLTSGALTQTQTNQLYNGNGSRPLAINDNGYVLGHSTSSAAEGLYWHPQTGGHATFRTENGYTYQDLFRAINNSNTVVGTTYTESPAGTIANGKCVIDSLSDSNFTRIEFDATEALPANPPSTNTSCHLTNITESGIAAGFLQYHGVTPNQVESFIYDPAKGVAENLLDKVNFPSNNPRSLFADFKIKHMNNAGQIVGAHTHPNFTSERYYYFEKVVVPQPQQQVIDNDGNTHASRDWLVIHREIRVIIPIGDVHWQDASTLTGAHNGSYKIAIQDGKTKPVFTWHTDPINADGDVDVFAKWPVDGANDRNATYEIYKNHVLIDTVFKDQSGNSAQDGFETLGRYSVLTGDVLSIKLKGSGVGNLIADAIKIDNAN